MGSQKRPNQRTDREQTRMKGRACKYPKQGQKCYWSIRGKRQSTWLRGGCGTCKKSHEGVVLRRQAFHSRHEVEKSRESTRRTAGEKTDGEGRLQCERVVRSVVMGRNLGKVVWSHIMNVTAKSLYFMQNSRRSQTSDTLDHSVLNACPYMIC